MNANILKFAAATNNELFDSEWKGGEWMTEAVETHETIGNFIDASKNYAKCSPSKTGTIAGFPFIAWRQIQVSKGKKRRSLSVVDFGDVRFAIETDLSDFT